MLSNISSRAHVISDVNYADPAQVEFLRAQLEHQYETKCFGTRKITGPELKLNLLHQLTPQQNLSTRNQTSSTTSRTAQQQTKQQRHGTFSHRETSHDSPRKQTPGSTTSRQLAKQSVTMPTTTRNKNIVGSTQAVVDTFTLSPYIQSRLEEQISTENTNMNNNTTDNLYPTSPSKQIRGVSQDSTRRSFYSAIKQEKPLQLTEQEQNIGYEIHQVNPTLLKSNRRTHKLNTTQQQQQLQKVEAYPHSARNHHAKSEQKPSSLKQLSSQEKITPRVVIIDTSKNNKIDSSRSSNPLTNVRIVSEMESCDPPEPRASTSPIIKSQPQQSSRRRFIAVKDAPGSGIVHSEGFPRSKMEYQSDPAFKLIEEYNKSNQNVNLHNIKANSQYLKSNEHSTSNKPLLPAYKPLPYYHNFFTSFKEFKAEESTKKVTSTSAIDQLTKVASTQNELCDSVRFPRKTAVEAAVGTDQQQAVNGEQSPIQVEEFNYYQKSTNRHECLYLCRNQRVATVTQPVRTKPVVINVGAAMQKVKESIDPREEFRRNKRRLERILSISPNKKSRRQKVSLQPNSSVAETAENSAQQMQQISLSTTYSRSRGKSMYATTNALRNNQSNIQSFIFNNNEG